jgi:hypothetical protein
MNTRDKIEAFLVDINPDAMFADGFDDALIGIAGRINLGPVALYDRDRCLAVLVRDYEMTESQAEEYMSFNVEGAWVGEGTPLFCELFKEER